MTTHRAKMIGIECEWRMLFDFCMAEAHSETALAEQVRLAKLATHGRRAGQARVGAQLPDSPPIPREAGPRSGWCGGTGPPRLAPDVIYPLIARADDAGVVAVAAARSRTAARAAKDTRGTGR